MLLAAVVAILVTAREAPAQPASTLPRWETPEQYSVDMVLRSAGEAMVMKQFVDRGRTRMEINAGEHAVVVISRPDLGVAWIVAPGEQRSYLEYRIASPAAPEASASPPAIRDLGTETLDGRRCRKYEIAAEGQTALMWVDHETHAPVRIQDGERSIEWQNLRPGPQPAALFEPPAGYQRVAIPDMKTMMGRAAGQMALGMGAMAAGQAMAAAGAAVGGPIGAVVGQYVGQHVAGWLLGKTQGAMMPGAVGPGR